MGSRLAHALPWQDALGLQARRQAVLRHPSVYPPAPLPTPLPPRLQ